MVTLPLPPRAPEGWGCREWAGSGYQVRVDTSNHVEQVAAHEPNETFPTPPPHPTPTPTRTSCISTLGITIPSAPSEPCVLQVGVPDRGPHVGVLQHHRVRGLRGGRGEDGRGGAHHAARVDCRPHFWGHECDRLPPPPSLPLPWLTHGCEPGSDEDGSSI